MDDPNDTPREGFVPNYLLYLLAAASEAASAEFHAHIRAQGLRVVEWRVLGCLADGNGQMMTRLAKVALYEQSRMTRIIEKMEERGLVTRRPDPDDGRRVRVHLTDEGKNISDRLVRDAGLHEKKLLDAIAHEEGSDIKTVLKALIEHMEENTSVAK